LVPKRRRKDASVWSSVVFALLNKAGNSHFAMAGAVRRALIIDPLPRNAGDVTAFRALAFD